MATLNNSLVADTATFARHANSQVSETTPLAHHTSHVRLSSNQAHDLPIFSPTKNISGTIYQPGGSVVPGATVKLVRQFDDLVCQVGVTDSGGHYFFLRDAGDTFAYYVIAYTSATSPQVHGTSDRGVVPA